MTKAGCCGVGQKWNCSVCGVSLVSKVDKQLQVCCAAPERNLGFCRPLRGMCIVPGGCLCGGVGVAGGCKSNGRQHEGCQRGDGNLRCLFSMQGTLVVASGGKCDMRLGDDSRRECIATK